MAWVRPLIAASISVFRARSFSNWSCKRSLIESPSIYADLSVTRNLEIQLQSLRSSEGKARVTEVLELVGLSDRSNDRARVLSLGMKQRLGIAIALVGRPELVILDEPANGLDPSGIVEIRLLLRSLAGTGTTVLVSSHQLAETQQACDELVVMNDGRLVAIGSVGEILRTSSVNAFVVRLVGQDFESGLIALRKEGLRCETFGSEIRISLPHGWSGREVNQTLAVHRIHPLELRQETATLEQVFLELTTNKQDQGNYVEV